MATRALLAHAEQGFTGRLTLGRGNLQVSTHLLRGDLIAATSADDQSQVVRMLSLRGIVTPGDGDGLEERIAAGESVFGDLLEMAGGPLLDGVLRDRFIQNLSEFVSSSLAPEAIAEKAVFVENIQLGHRTTDLVLATCDDYDAAMQVEPDLLVVRGAVDPGRGSARALLLTKLGPHPRTVRSIIQEAPLEPLRARLMLAELLQTGAAEVATETERTPPRLAPANPAVNSAVSGNSPPPGGPRAGGVAVADNEAMHLPLDAHVPLNLQAAEGAAPVVQDELVPPANEDEDLTDDPTVRVPSENYLHVSTHVEDEELFAFDDHDRGRGSGSGTFSTKEHHRDRVEVSSWSDLGRATPSGNPEPTSSSPRSPAVRFAGPSIRDDEALNKIRVANQVLSQVRAAFDEVVSAGRGRAVLQLLVDGGPSRYSVLMRDLRVSEEGDLPEPMLLMNLRKRPEAEQRQLLHNSLIDIIERALSSAADEMPDEALDRLLQTVAGYRNRMGGNSDA